MEINRNCGNVSRFIRSLNSAPVNTTAHSAFWGLRRFLFRFFIRGDKTDLMADKLRLSDEGQKTLAEVFVETFAVYWADGWEIRGAFVRIFRIFSCLFYLNTWLFFLKLTYSLKVVLDILNHLFYYNSM